METARVFDSPNILMLFIEASIDEVIPTRFCIAPIQAIIAGPIKLAILRAP